MFITPGLDFVLSIKDSTAMLRFNVWLSWGLSLGIHSLILLFLLLQVQKNIPPRGQFRTTVYFEVSEKDKDIQKSDLKQIKKPQPTKPVQKAINLQHLKLLQQFKSLQQSKLMPQKGKPNEPAGKLLEVSHEKTPLTKKQVEAAPASNNEVGQKQESKQAQTQLTNSHEKDASVESLEQKSKNFATQWKSQQEKSNYREILARLVIMNWKLPLVSQKSFEMLFEVLIDPKGNIKQITKLRSSELAILDSSAEKAIRLSEPFPEFPSNFSPELLYFKAVFRFTPETGRK